MLRLFLTLFLVLTAGCTSPGVREQLPQQPPFISILMKSGAFSGPVKSQTGWLFYVIDSKPIKGPFFVGYRLVNGEIRERLLTGSSSAKVVAQIDSIDLRPFDWTSELKAAEERLAKSLPEGEAIAAPLTLDGAEWEIVIHTKHGTFEMREWNPGPQIDFYAAYSDRINRLHRILDAIALFQGYQKLGI